MRPVIVRGSTRAIAAMGLVALHAVLGAWLGLADPISAGIAVDGVTLLGLAAFAGLRLVVWFGVVPWLVAGAFADWLRYRSQVRPAQPA